MMNYNDAMNYFYSIMPFTQSYALKYVFGQAFWFILVCILITAIVIYLLFLYETKHFEKKYQEKAGFSFEDFLLSGDVLIPVALIMVVGTLIAGIASFHTKYYVDNSISKKDVIESPYFRSLNDQSKQFVKNYLFVGELVLKTSSLNKEFLNSNGDVDVSKIDLNFFSPNINLKDLENLIEDEIEYRETLNNELERNENYRKEMIDYIQNAK